MANYLNGSFRGLALGMQFMQNQERLAAEKSMQVERIVANKALQDDRIAANAALQTERIAFDTKAMMRTHAVLILRAGICSISRGSITLIRQTS